MLPTWVYSTFEYLDSGRAYLTAVYIDDTNNLG